MKSENHALECKTTYLLIANARTSFKAVGSRLFPGGFFPEQPSGIDTEFLGMTA